MPRWIARTVFMAFAVALAFTPIPTSADEAKDTRKKIDKDLREYFKMLPKRRFFDPRKVFGVGGQAPSRMCMVQHRGIMVKFPKDENDMSIPVTSVENGVIIAASSGQFLGQTSALTRPLRLGEAVYLSDVDVSEGDITFFLRTAEPETWFTVKACPQGTLRFKMDAATIGALTGESVLALTKAFFLSEEDAAKIPPPTVALGQTPDEVTAILGKPKSIVNLGAKQVYSFDNMKVIFLDGKVSDVQ